MTKIINNTPHTVNIINPDDIHFDTSIRKWVAEPDVTPIMSIPSSGVLNAKIDTVEATPIGDVPIFDKKINGCDSIPDDGNIHIVSALYMAAARAAGLDISHLMLVADPVMSEDGKTFIGCRGLAKAF